MRTTIQQPFLKSNINLKKYFPSDKSRRDLCDEVRTLSKLDLQILNLQVIYTNIYESVWPAQGKIAKKLGVTVGWVNKRLQYLQRIGLIEIVSRGYPFTCSYFLPHFFLEWTTRLSLTQYLPALFYAGINKVQSFIQKPQYIVLTTSVVKKNNRSNKESLREESPSRARRSRGDPSIEHIFSEGEGNLPKKPLKCTEVPLEKREKAISNPINRKGNGYMRSSKAHRDSWSLMNVAAEVKNCLDEEFLEGFSKIMPLERAMSHRNGIIANTVNGKVRDIVSSNSPIEDKAKKYILWKCKNLGIEVTHPVYENKEAE